MNDLLTFDRRTAIFGLAAAGLAGRASAQPAAQGWRVLPTEAFQGKQDDIHFVSADVGWYGNGAGKLYRTLDGGESWTKVWERPGTFIRALGFVDRRRGFLGNIGTDYFPTGTDPRPLYRTADGGATWTPVEAEGIGAVRGICGIDVLAGGRVIHAAGRVSGPAAMLRSTDGGESWRLSDLSAVAGMILDVKFFDPRHGFLCAATASDTAQANALILRTSDGGRNWEPVYRSSRRFENVWKMHFPTRRTGYATVQNYEPGTSRRVIVKTEDGGATWRELPLVDDARVREFGIGFVDERWGWAGTSTSGFETRDGGQSWAPIEMGRAVNKIRIVRQGRRTRAFAIGTTVLRRDIA
jgi:photosystem II stability/assembly factor-like uncharacterized protein